MAVASEEYRKRYAGTTTTGPYAITFPVVLDAGGNASAATRQYNITLPINLVADL